MFENIFLFLVKALKKFSYWTAGCADITIFLWEPKLMMSHICKKNICSNRSNFNLTSGHWSEMFLWHTCFGQVRSLFPICARRHFSALIVGGWGWKRSGAETPTGNPSPAPTHPHRTHDTTDQWRDPRLWLGWFFKKCPALWPNASNVQGAPPHFSATLMKRFLNKSWAPELLSRGQIHLELV